jgi:hypothetical protein
MVETVAIKELAVEMSWQTSRLRMKSMTTSNQEHYTHPIHPTRKRYHI